MSEQVKQQRTDLCETFLRGVRDRASVEAPELLATLDSYAGEARFARALLEDDLAGLPRGASILEVGAGASILSCILACEGYTVTAVEPTGSGFSHFERLRSIVVTYATEHDGTPTLLDVSGEEFNCADCFDYAFSINVMEHVRDIACVLRNVQASLKRGATYRFICPNYAFPYEPHFNLPTLWNKAFTYKLMSRRIMTSRRVIDPAGTWASLNWITVRQVRRIALHLGTRAVFDRRIFQTYLSRSISDSVFRERRGAVLNWLVVTLARAGISGAVGSIPVAWLPVMDCRIVRP